MTLTETAQLLALARAVDGRAVDETTVASWHALVGDLDFTDAQTALRSFYRTESRWLTPADIVAGVRRIRDDRAERVPLEQLLCGNPEEAKRAARRREQLQALQPGSARPADDSRQLIADRLGMRDRSAAASVHCPWCGAEPRIPCSIPGTTRQLARFHPARVEAALGVGQPMAASA